MTRPVAIRIVGTALPGRSCGPTTDVAVGLQVGSAHVGLVPGDAPGAGWQVVIDVGRDDDGALVARGPAVHGPKDERFLYLAWVGRTDGVVGLFRRTKLQLDGIPAGLVDEAGATGRPLVASLALRDARGGPLCASVRPPLVAWSLG